MKKLLIFWALLMPLAVYAQSDNVQKKPTKYEQLISETGKLIKFTDVAMPAIPSGVGLFAEKLQNDVRIFLGTERNAYFYRIERAATSSRPSYVAMIEYSDLVEVNKALEILKKEVAKDIETKPDYLENKFVTEDGLQVGYYLKKRNATWFITLERYGNSTIYIDSADELVNNFRNAQTRIEELKASYGK